MVRTLYFVVSGRNIVFRTIFRSGEGHPSPKGEAEPRGEAGYSCYDSVITRMYSLVSSILIGREVSRHVQHMCVRIEVSY